MEAPTPAQAPREARQAREGQGPQDAPDGAAPVLGPRLAGRILNYGVDARQRNDNQTALDAFELVAWAIAGEIQPSHNMAETLIAEGRHDEARDWLWRSVRIMPHAKDGWYSLGIAEWKMGNPHAALAPLRKALTFAPHDAEVRHNLGVISLAVGDYGPGWENYLWRLVVQRRKRPLSPWVRGDVQKSIVLLPEQGLGDILYFARWWPYLKNWGIERVCCPYPKKIAPVMARAGLDVIDGFGREMDGEVRIGDVPFLTQIDGPLPSLSLRTEPLADPRLDAARRPLIGLTWRAGTKNENGQWKETPVAPLVDLMKSVGGTAVLIQRKADRGEVIAFESAGVPVIDYGTECDAPLFVLDLLPRLDAYVTVSNTNVHLAAGLGAQMPAMHVLVTHPPEARWMVSGDGSPWFPGMTAYRQDGRFRWSEGTFERIKEALANDARR